MGMCLTKCHSHQARFNDIATLAGINESKVIIATHNDIEALIFKIWRRYLP